MVSSYAVKHRDRAEQLQRLKARPGRRPADAALSSVLAAAPSSFDGRKIAAVDKNIAALDSLPERYAGVKTLYVSKNSLRNLHGIEQFTELKALSAADNFIADLDALCVLPAASIQLEAASFEGNPIADLPNYRAHVIHILGPSLTMLDNRAVTPEERRGAAGAVAHEATMLTLMVANACLVHKLGRVVQLVKLHCELQCAVLGGQYGGGAAAGAGDIGEGIRSSGQSVNRLLQCWDYEGSLGRQERHAIGLAIRREVGRRHRKLVLAGAKPEGSPKLWQQAFAQVMMLQQETIASLMQLLEEAKAEAAATLAPITRPASPMKRRALQSDQDAQNRVRQDREALIHELRDAFLGLADAAAHSNAPQRTAEFEAKIRELHAALEAASGTDPTPQSSPQQQQQQQQQVKSGQDEEQASPRAGQWALPAVHAVPAEQGRETAAAPTPRQPGSGRLKSALKQPSSSGGSTASPGRPVVRVHAVCGPEPGAGQPSEVPPRPASARPGPTATVLGWPAAAQRPGTAPSSRQNSEGQVGWQQQEQQRWARQQWQADDGLAGYEDMEQARCKTPRPFQASSERQWDAGQAGEAGSRPQVPPLALQQAQAASQPAGPGPHAQQQVYNGPAAAPVPALLPSGIPTAHSDSTGSSSPLRSRPSSPKCSRPGSPPSARPGSASRPGSPSAQWIPNPLASQSSSALGRHDGGGGSLHGIFQLLEREGRLNQLEALRSAVRQYETTVAELQSSNHELVQEVRQARQRAQAIEARLAQQELAAAAAQQEAAARQLEAEQQQERQEEQLAAVGRRLEEMLTSRQALQAQLEAAKALAQQLAEQTLKEKEAAAADAERAQQVAGATVQQLQSRVTELESEKAVQQSLAVSHEAEFKAEAVRAAALEARAGELQARLAAYQRQERLEAACTKLAARSIQRRVMVRWQEAAAEQVRLHAMQEQADALYRQTLLARWLSKWRMATQRSRALDAWERQRQQHRLQLAWQALRLYRQDCILRRGLDAAAGLHRQSVMLKQSFVAWRQQTDACRQVELSLQHPVMKVALRQQRYRLLRSVFGAWRQYMRQHVAPRKAQVQVCMLQQLMGSQRRAFLAWQQYLQYRRRAQLHESLAQQHHLRLVLRHWLRTTLEAGQERASVEEGAAMHQMLLLRRGWQAWRHAVQEEQREEQGMVLAEQHHRQRLLAKCWEGLQEWTVLCRRVRQRRDTRLQATALMSWRLAAKSAEKKRLADAFHQHCLQRRYRASFYAWCDTVAAKRQRHCQVAHAQALLQRRLLGRVLAAWRRAALAGKLCQTLGVVQQLQSAVERIRGELEHKAQEFDTLQSIKVTVEGQSETLSLQVRSLDADLASAQAQAAELQAAAQAAQAAAQAAQEQQQATVAAMQQAQSDAEAARAQRDTAVSGREQAEADKQAACAARHAAEQQASDASAKAEAAAAAAAAAMTQAAGASAALEQLMQEHQAVKDQVEQLQAERQGLQTDLEKAVGQVQDSAQALEQLQAERDKLRRQLEDAVQGCTTAAAEQQAALRQAERLTALCEEQEEQCQRLQVQVAQLQGALGSQPALQEELAQLAEQNQQLQDNNQYLQGQLERVSTALQQADADRTALEEAAQGLRAEQRRLQEQSDKQEAELGQLALLAESLQDAKAALELQLARAQEEGVQSAEERQQLAAAVEGLRAEREQLLASGQQLQAEKAGVEATVARLREQLQQSNGVLDACRQMLGECCSARAAADQSASSLTEMLKALKAEQLLKDASIKALARENAQRAERLEALQSQVAQLSQQVAQHGDGQGPLGPLGAHMQQGQQEQLAGAGTAVGPTPWAGLAPPSSPFPLPPQAGATPMARPFSPRATPTPAGVGVEAAAGAVPYTSSRHMEAAPASGMVPGSNNRGRVQSGATPVPTFQQPQPQPQHNATVQHLTFASPGPAAARSPAPSYMSVSVSTQPQPWQASTPAHSSSGASKALHVSSAPGSSRVPMPTPLPNSAATVNRASAGLGHASQSPLPCHPLWRNSGAATPVAAAAVAAVARPASAAHAPLAPELSDQQLSCLVELVVKKRITAAQAQQVITSAAKGDVQPLLHVIDSLEAGTTPAPPMPATAAAAAAAAAPCPVSAAELAEVRQQVQELRQFRVR